ncbi:SPARC-like [Salvelinus alpinus]|uniref:SPARC-like n=1 Tax=Salvelinus alpinus TaxID=8036 RepID=UPI0039FD08A1
MEKMGDTWRGVEKITRTALVLEALCAAPFEPLELVDLKILSYKSSLLMALASAKCVGGLHALSVQRSCTQFTPGDSKVCGTDNVTYDTSCELFATKCNLEGTKRSHRLHLDYTGPCKFIAPCMDAELVQFPLRMRDWLKNVLLHLYEHDSMSPGFLILKQRIRVRKIHESERRLHAGDHPIELLAQDFEKNYNMYIYPVHWQFAQMDQHPSDRFLSHSELAPLRVPLVPMEHCTSRFFQECDADKDKQVSFREWIHCFGIKDEDIDVNLLF